MKRFLIFAASVILLAVFNPVLAQNRELTNERQWVWQNPLPQGNDLNDMYVFDENTAIAVGKMGTIIKTTDGGMSWYKYESNSTSELNSVFFINNNTGWAGGYTNTLCKTIDGGKTWKTQIFNKFPESVSLHVSDLYFTDENKGWISGGGFIYSTTDGGESWIEMETAPEWGAERIQFFNNDTAVIFSGGMPWYTNNGGLVWEMKNPNFNDPNFPLCVPYDMFFVDENHGWLVGGDEANHTGKISASTDGGLTWIAQTPGTSEVIYSVHFTDTLNGWAAGEDVILNTTDGGNTWNITDTIIENGISMTLNNIKFSDTQTGFFVGDYGIIYKTTNAGAEWISLISSPVVHNNYFYDIEFTDDTTGYVVGTSGSLLKTTDGGETWSAKNTGISDVYTSLNKIQMINSNTGYAVGNMGAIIKTTDAGETWTPQVSGLTSSLYSLHFPENDLTGWVSGSLAKLLKTTDGGQNWTAQNVGVSGSYVLHFFNNLEGYIMSGNKFYKTTDGGNTWTYTTIDPNVVTIISTTFYCQDELTFFVLTTNGKIYKTIDAGNTWTELIHIGLGLYGIETTPESIIAVGNGGVIIKSTDGGINWTLEDTETHLSLKAIHIKNDSTMWVCGERGAILHLGGMKPLSITITGEDTYCAGTDGSPIGLEDSEIDVVYTLLKNGVAQLPTVTGTGSAVSFGNQLQGIYKVSAENQYGTTILQDVVTITEIPYLPAIVIVADETTICSNSSTNISTTENYTYTTWQHSSDNSNWTDIPDLISNTLLVSDIEQTTYYRAITSNQCETLTSTSVEIIVDLAPVGGDAVAEDNSVCLSGSTTINLSNYTGQIQWQNSLDNTTWENIVGANSEAYLTPEIMVTNYFRAELTNGVCIGSNFSSVASVVVSGQAPAQPSEISGSTQPLPSSTQTYSVVNIEGVTYTWSVPSDWTILAGNLSNTIAVTVGSVSGNIEVVPSNDCGNGEAQTLVVDVLTSTSELLETEFSVYPNPASTFISIETNAMELNSRIEIINTDGKVVYNGLLDNQMRKEINIENLNSGIYVIKITNNRNSKFVKFLVQK